MRLLATILFLSALVPVAARADGDVDYIEQQLGATAINGAVGNGATAAGVSAQGELTVLRWPSPSYFEHVQFRTQTGKGVRSLPHFGALDNMGSFAGVRVEPGEGGAAASFSYARDEGWTATQAYAADDSNQLITTLHNARLRITVTVNDTVAAEASHVGDVLVRGITVTPDVGFHPTALRLVYFVNLAPAIEKADFFPNDQTNLLEKRDYAIGMSGALGALVHFSVAGRPAQLVAPLGAAGSPADVDAFLSASIAGKGMDTAGMYWVIGGQVAPDEFQCGYDVVPAPMGAPKDAYQDAIDGAGKLSNSPAALAHADGALAFDLPPAGGHVDVFFAPGTTYDDAAGRFRAARARGGDDIRDTDLAYWKTLLKDRAMPDTKDADRLRLARRALLSIAVGRDNSSGAVVASISSQPPYNLDWPRDSAFIDYALDVSGYHDWVGQHRIFLASVQRQHDGDVSAGGDAPAGSWATDYYADGHPGGPIPFEIDEVGFSLWAFYEHAKWIDEPARSEYLQRVYPAILLGANLLTTCVDTATGLQCLANEDDNFAPTITLHGAVAVRLGLASSIRAANYLSKWEDARRFRARLDQLDAALEKSFGDAALGYRGTQSPLPDVVATGSVSWAIWPAALRPLDDPRMKLAAAQIEADYQPFFNQTNAGGAYCNFSITSAANLTAAARRS